jgi:glycosyltransferase involved in cell wall biosynthesis
LAFPIGGLADGFSELLPGAWCRWMANRRANLPLGKLQRSPLRELVALLELKLGAEPQEVLYRRNSAFQRAIPDSAITQADAVIGFDTSSWILAQRAREFDRTFFLDRSIGHPRAFARVAKRCKKQFPEWSAQIFGKTDKELLREDQEHTVASRIVVPSRFVATTLTENGVDPAKIRVNPFGTDLEQFHPSRTLPSFEHLRFIFAGSLQPRKGLPLLLKAWSHLPQRDGAELWIAGEGEIPQSLRCDIPQSIRFLGRLAPADLSQAFRQCHVFVFPSYFEGLAQVQIEAAACGLPVIGTDSSGCEEIVRDNETGFILPTGDVDALRSALVRFISGSDLVLLMRERLLAQRDQWSWGAYGDRWATLLRENLQPQ